MIRNKTWKGIATCLFLLISGCKSAPSILPAEEMGSAPSGEPRKGIETIAILGTNDLHGSLVPFSLKSREANGVEPVEYEAAGAAVLGAYVNRLREEFGDHLIWLDAGDEFQGSVESNTELGAPMVSFFNSLKLTAAAVGNHEFDFGVPALKSRMKEAEYPYLAANIIDKSTEKPASFPNTLPSVLIGSGRLKVGIIGLSTLDTPKTTRADHIENYKFENLKVATLREAKKLRNQGAHIVLITGHIGLKCSLGRMTAAHAIRKATDHQGVCGDQDEMVRLLRSLPAGTVDAAVAGHSHQVVHHWVAGVPVIQAGAFGRYLNVIYLNYDWQQREILTDQTRIEGPIPVCENIFQHQGDCNGDQPAPHGGRGPLVSAKFHGQVIKADSQIAQLIKPVIKRAERFRNQQLGVASRPIGLNRMQESELGNLVADALRHAVKTDFALVNSGGVRAPMEQGPIAFGDAFRSVPFDNAIAILKVNGQELETLLEVAESGARGMSSVSGLRLKLADPEGPGIQNDLNEDGKREEWEVNRILEVRQADGKPIRPQDWYTLATLDFLAMGGDDMEWPMSRIPSERINLHTGILARDALVKYIQEKRIVNTADQPLIDPSQPRLAFEKRSVSKAKKHRSHHRRNKIRRN